MTDPPQSHDDFFVGYLTTPRRARRFLVWLIPSAIAAALVTAAISTAQHADPGAANWDTDHITVIEGIADIAPYAMIRARDSNATIRTTLLVAEGKHGAIDRIRPFAGKSVRVHGHLLQRDGQQLLELDSSPSAIETLQNTPASIPPSSPQMLGRETLRGEIIDPKCYFGAMKPGEGKVHKECATLCIAGGIPPMFRTTDNFGRPAYYVVVAEDGSTANQLVLPHVAEPIEITADVELRNDLFVMRVSPVKIRPIQ